MLASAPRFLPWLVATLLAQGCLSSTEQCVRAHLSYLSQGEERLHCGWRVRVRRTGMPCGADHEAVEVEGCWWESWSNGKAVKKTPVIVYIPRDRASCDLRAQAGGLCFE